MYERWCTRDKVTTSRDHRMPKYDVVVIGTGSAASTFYGRAHFVGLVAVQVGNDVLEATNVVVASGSRPAGA